jgi:hypothetical protein
VSNDKPGTDWAAKQAAAGSQAQPAADRPQQVDYSSVQPVSESDVTYGRPAGAVDES